MAKKTLITLLAGMMLLTGCSKAEPNLIAEEAPSEESLTSTDDSNYEDTEEYIMEDMSEGNREEDDIVRDGITYYTNWSLADIVQRNDETLFLFETYFDMQPFGVGTDEERAFFNKINVSAKGENIQRTLYYTLPVRYDRQLATAAKMPYLVMMTVNGNYEPKDLKLSYEDIEYRITEDTDSELDAYFTVDKEDEIVPLYKYQFFKNDDKWYVLKNVRASVSDSEGPLHQYYWFGSIVDFETLEVAENIDYTHTKMVWEDTSGAARFNDFTEGEYYYKLYDENVLTDEESFYEDRLEMEVGADISSEFIDASDYGACDSRVYPVFKIVDMQS